MKKSYVEKETMSTQQVDRHHAGSSPASGMMKASATVLGTAALMAAPPPRRG